MKLLSMTDFVLGSEKNFSENRESWAIDCLESIFEYANFLKQPLKLEMFVPCDEEGNVLKEPEFYKEWISELEKGIEHEFDSACMKHYQKAKEKVLFEGFELYENSIYKTLKFSNSTNQNEYINQDFAGFYFYDSSNSRNRLNTIEDLLKFNSLSLTPSAITQIGL